MNLSLLHNLPDNRVIRLPWIIRSVRKNIGIILLAGIILLYVFRKSLLCKLMKIDFPAHKRKLDLFETQNKSE